MIELKINKRNNVVNVSSDPFVAELINVNAQESTLTDLIGNLFAQQAPKPIILEGREHLICFNIYFSPVESKNNHCTVPESRYQPYLVGWSPVTFVVIDIIYWMADKYGLSVEDWKNVKRMHTYNLIDPIRNIVSGLIVGIDAKEILDSTQAEKDILEIMVDYMNNEPTFGEVDKVEEFEELDKVKNRPPAIIKHLREWFKLKYGH